LIQENKESAATGGNYQDGTLTSQLEEFKESMARKSNIIIFRKYLLHLSSILRFFIAFSSQGGQYQCRSDRLVSSLYSVLLNLTQERQRQKG
jgi:hypothetical protein